MNKIESQEGNPSMCGAVLRLCWLIGGDTGKNAGSHSRQCLWSLQAAPVVTPGRSVHSGAWAASRLPCLNAERASVNAGTAAHGTTSQARRVPALPGVNTCARTCPGLAKPAQECPAWPDAFPVLGRMRDNCGNVVRHGGGPRYPGLRDVDSTRRASVRHRRGTPRSAALPQAQRAAPSQDGSQP